MRRSIFKTVGAAVALVAIAAPDIVTAGKGPVTEEKSIEIDSIPQGCMRLDSAYIDLGVIAPDTVVEVSMRFVNSGNGPLSILRVYSDCGCTVPDYSSDPVEPGGEGEIHIRFNSRGRTPGAFRKSLRIRTDGRTPRETIILKGRVRRD